jgi:hypothetical protein
MEYGNNLVLDQLILVLYSGCNLTRGDTTMITKRQKQHLSGLIQEYAELREQLYWELDQGWSACAREVLQNETDNARAKMDAYLNRITEKAK